MTDGTLTQPTTQSVAVPGATVTYDVRPANGTTTRAAADAHRLADGRRRLRHARGPTSRTGRS